MHGKYLLFDVETIPCSWAMKADPFKSGIFQPEPVKLGNRTHPAKVEAKKIEHEMREEKRYADFMAKQADNQAAYYSSLSMSPAHAQIVNIGIFDE